MHPVAADQGSIVPSEFRAAWWLRGPHAQTLFPFLARRNLSVPTRRERLDLPDGDFLDLDWAVTPEKTGPRVLILHGLEGSIRSHYAGGLLRCLAQVSFRGLLMHFRGCSGEPNRLPRSYHSGETGDLDYVVNLLHAIEPESPIAIVGISLGGNVLLKWLGERGPDAPVAAAVAISVPFRLARAADRLDRGASRLYQAYLLHKLRSSLKAKQRRIQLPFRIEPGQLRTFRTFDDAVTAPLHGFTGVDDYYERASSLPYLSRIARPTLILQSADDPFMTPDIIPRADQLSNNVRLELSRRGGHVGFVSGPLPWRPVYWLERRIPAFLWDNIAI